MQQMVQQLMANPDTMRTVCTLPMAIADIMYTVHTPMHSHGQLGYYVHITYTHALPWPHSTYTRALPWPTQIPCTQYIHPCTPMANPDTMYTVHTLMHSHGQPGYWTCLLRVGFGFFSNPPPMGGFHIFSIEFLGRLSKSGGGFRRLLARRVVSKNSRLVFYPFSQGKFQI